MSRKQLRFLKSNKWEASEHVISKTHKFHKRIKCAKVHVLHYLKLYDWPCEILVIHRHIFSFLNFFKRRYLVLNVNILQDFNTLCDQRGKQPFWRLKMPIRSVVIECHEWSSCPDDKKLMPLSNFSIRISNDTIPLTLQSMNYV